MEVVETLADGDDGVRWVGIHEYFESFYDWIPHREDGAICSNSAITADEQALLLEVSNILDDACDTTPGGMTDDEFIATGWPKRVQPVALKALILMRERGWFCEEQEEDAPSIPEWWWKLKTSVLVIIKRPPKSSIQVMTGRIRISWRKTAAKLFAVQR